MLGPARRAAPAATEGATLGAQDLRELAARYLEGTRIFRKRSAPYFIDKMPNNWLYVGLIHLLLPQATLIDARRHPLGCCFSCFKQQFARGQNFTYDLEDLGRCYRDYVGLMHHFDAVLPGRVYRVHYESMVTDTETEVRRLLVHCETCRSRRAACASTRMSGRCARRAPSRCASRFSRMRLNNGDITSRRSGR
jgi:hypothetical protein